MLHTCPEIAYRERCCFRATRRYISPCNSITRTYSTSWFRCTVSRRSLSLFFSRSFLLSREPRTKQQKNRIADGTAEIFCFQARIRTYATTAARRPGNTWCPRRQRSVRTRFAVSAQLFREGKRPLGREKERENTNVILVIVDDF